MINSILHFNEFGVKKLEKTMINFSEDVTVDCQVKLTHWGFGPKKRPHPLLYIFKYNLIDMRSFYHTQN